MQIQELFDRLKAKYPKSKISVSQCVETNGRGYTVLEVDETSVSTAATYSDEVLLEKLDAAMPTSEQKIAAMKEQHAKLLADAAALAAQIPAGEPL